MSSSIGRPSGSCHSTVLRDGRRVSVEYGEVDHCCENFRLMDGWLDQAGLQQAEPAIELTGSPVPGRGAEAPGSTTSSVVASA